MLLRSIFLAVLLSSATSQLLAQACCSGGVPVSGNLGLPASSAEVLQLSVSYDLNVLQTLKAGTETLDDDSRNRTTHSALFEIGYSLTNRFSVDGFFSFVRQERTISQFGNENFTYSQGIGDAVVLFKYKLLSFQNDATALQIGFGPKIPLGAADRKDDRGITLNADLQPGSGAWDAIFWSQFAHAMAFRPSLSLISTVTYAYKGVNDSYLGSESYQFGQEWQIMAGLSDRLFIGKNIVDPSLRLQFRTVRPDQFNDEQQPGTGGEWVFIIPGFTYWLNPDLSVNANLSLPIYARLEDTQVTPTYRFTTGVYYRLAFANSAPFVSPPVGILTD